MIFIDSADRAELSQALSLPYCKGFTTNPTLFLRALGVQELSLAEYVSAARSLVDFAAGDAKARDVMIQGVGAPGQVLAQLHAYRDALGAVRDTTLWIKLLPTREHLSLCPDIASLGCKSLVTAVFTPAQACAAMESGADGVAVYLGRTMKQDDWETTLESIARLVLPREKMLLMASLADAWKVEAALRYSADITVPFAMIDQLLRSPHSDEAIATFTAQVGEDVTSDVTTSDMGQ
jgi:transaldolase